MLMGVLAAEFDAFRWLVLPAMIFAARVVDVTLGTVRVIFISRGMKYLAPILAFCEIMIWLLAIGQIMTNLKNPACYVAYAGGFATGNFVGICVAEKLSLGLALIRIITQRDAQPLVERLQAEHYGVTSLDGHGARGPVKVIFTIVPRREVPRVVEIIRSFNPNAFYTVGDVTSVASGQFPPRRLWHDTPFLRVFRPFRKGK